MDSMNEELAKSLWYYHCTRHSCNGKECKNCEHAEADDAVLDVAKYKDDKFKEIIASTLDYFDRGRENGFVSQNSFDDMKYFVSKLNEKLLEEN